MFHFSEHIFHNMKVPSQLRLQQRRTGGHATLQAPRGVYLPMTEASSSL